MAKRYIQLYKEQIDVLDSIQFLSFDYDKHGNIYKLDVPEDYEILNWDAKLSEQPEQIMPAIREAVDMLNNHPEKGLLAIFAPRLKKSKSASANLERLFNSLVEKYRGHHIDTYERRSLPEYEAVRKLFYAKDKTAADDFFDKVNSVLTGSKKHKTFDLVH